MQTTVKELQRIAVIKNNLQKQLIRLERNEGSLMLKLTELARKRSEKAEKRIIWDTENVFIPDEELQEGMWNYEGNTYMTQDAAIKYGSTLKGKRLATNEDHIDLNKTYDGGVWDEEKKGRYFGELFFPALGGYYFKHNDTFGVGTLGYYWSASPNGVYGCTLGFYSTYVDPSNSSNRAYGFSVRCVREL